MINFESLNRRIAPPDETALTSAQVRWNSLAKPEGSLGLLEDAVSRMAALTGKAAVKLAKRAVLVFCADNGIAAEGVTQTGQEVTAALAGSMAKGKVSVCCMAAAAHADVFPVDIGMRFSAPGMLDYKIAEGTANFTLGPAMTPEQTERAIRTGMEFVRQLRDEGYDIIVTGEIGMGNTTTSSALVSVLRGVPVTDSTGRGAGLSDEGLLRKISAIERGIAKNNPDPNDAFDVLVKLGGFDIAGMVGVFIGGALYRVPVVIDGFISAASALVAARLCPACVCAMLASHISAEPGAAAVLGDLGLEPLLCAKLRLGEGTGGVCLLPLLDLALSVYDRMITLRELVSGQGGE